MAFYVWSTEIKHTDANGQTKSIKRGERIAKSDLPGISDEEWQAKITGGSIREKQFPAPKDYQGSAIDFLRDSLREAQTVSQVDEEEALGELANVVAVAPTTDKPGK